MEILLIVIISIVALAALVCFVLGIYCVFFSFKNNTPDGCLALFILGGLGLFISFVDAMLILLYHTVFVS